MLRKMIMAALAVTAVGLATPQPAQARGGFAGGGHIGGGHWGGGWHGGGFWPGVAIGAGYYGAYGYGYPYYGPYYYGVGYEDYGAQCYPVRKRVMTPWGWRVRRAQVCE